MKWVVGILIACVVALGVWLSLTVGRIEPEVQETHEAATNWSTYAAERFSIRYPNGYTVEPVTASGVRLIVDPRITNGTNLAQDTSVFVEQIPSTQMGGPECSAGRFFDQGASNYGQEITQNGVVYSFASSTGAAAGNRYDEYMYALKGSSPCIGVRYFIHYGAIENYPKGAVINFDRQALLTQFDTIRTSLEIL